ncbi:hypothetical protein BDR26DRAFT_898564 [Obelidium mucronatum]|nr:hypothetical protein BDR26DRAFT_959036 [Obelidium mucronatum]KAI9333299.1 hypothetical protein BDR26DRAFT_898564 [Obelidium mucronatum]
MPVNCPVRKGVPIRQPQQRRESLSASSSTTTHTPLRQKLGNTPLPLLPPSSSSVLPTPLPPCQLLPIPAARLDPSSQQSNLAENCLADGDGLATNRDSNVKGKVYKAVARQKKRDGIPTQPLVIRSSLHPYLLYKGNPQITIRPKTDQVEDQLRFDLREAQHALVIRIGLWLLLVPMKERGWDLHTVIDFLHGIAGFAGLVDGLTRRAARDMSAAELSKLTSNASAMHKMLTNTSQSNYKNYQRVLGLYPVYMEAVIALLDCEVATSRQRFEESKDRFLADYGEIPLDVNGFFVESLGADDEAEDSWLEASMASLQLKELSERRDLMQQYMKTPADIHGIAFIEHYAIQPKQTNKGVAVADGDRGNKAGGVDMFKTVFCLIVRLFQSLHSCSLDEKPQSLSTAVAEVNLDSAKYFAAKDLNVQKGKHDKKLSNSDRVAISKFYWNCNWLGGGGFRALAMESSLAATANRSHIFREANDVQMGTRFLNLSLQHGAPENKVEVLCLVNNNTKNSALFAKVGGSNRQYLDVAPNMDPELCMVLSIAVSKFVVHTVLGEPLPPFHEGLAACKDFKLFRGASATEAMGDTAARHGMRDCHTALGLYTNNNLLHRYRREIIPRLLEKNVPLDHAKRMGWNDAPDTNGKKKRDTADIHYFADFTPAAVKGVAGCHVESEYKPLWLSGAVPPSLVAQAFPQLPLKLLKDKLARRDEGFANGTETLKGILDSFDMYARVLFCGIAALLHRGVISQDHWLLQRSEFKSSEFVALLADVKRIYLIAATNTSASDVAPLTSPVPAISAVQ